MGEPNGKYSVRGVCVDAGEIRWWTWCLGLRPKSFFFFPRNPPDVDGDPVDVAVASLFPKDSPLQVKIKQNIFFLAHALFGGQSIS